MTFDSALPAFIKLVFTVFLELFLVYFSQLSDILTNQSSFRVSSKYSNLEVYDDLAIRFRWAKLKADGWSLKRRSYLDKV